MAYYSNNSCDYTVYFEYVYSCRPVYTECSKLKQLCPNCFLELEINCLRTHAHVSNFVITGLQAQITYGQARNCNVFHGINHLLCRRSSSLLHNFKQNLWSLYSLKLLLFLTIKIHVKQKVLSRYGFNSPSFQFLQRSQYYGHGFSTGLVVFILCCLL